MKKRFLAVILLIVMCLMLAPNVFADSKTPITSVTISGVNAPIIGQKCSLNTVKTSSAPANAAEIFPYWLDSVDGKLSSNDVFEEGHTYILMVCATPKEGYTFKFNADKNYTGTATVNGKKAEYPHELAGSGGCLIFQSSERMKPVKGTPITSIIITCTQTPVIGQKCTVDNVKITTVPTNAAGISPCWYDNTISKKMAVDRADYVFEKDHTYIFTAVLYPNSGYYFKYDSNKNYIGTATVNGKKAEDPHELAGSGGMLFLTSTEKLKSVVYAPKPKTYTLTTSVNGGHGSISAGKSGLAENSKQTVTFKPDSGYEIDNVTVNGVKTSVLSNTLSIKMDTNKTVVVSYRKKSASSATKSGFLVVFNTNGHGKPIPDQTVKKGEKATKPSNPAEQGFSFEGWYADDNLSVKFDFNSPITKDTMVYAKWVKGDAASSESDKDTASQESLTDDTASSSEELSKEADEKGTKETADIKATSKDKDEKKDKSNTKEVSAIIIILIIVVLCLIAGALAVIIAKKRKNKKEDTAV